MITMPAIVHSSSSEECFNWLKAVRETMRLLLLSGSRQAFFIGAAAWAAMTVTHSTMVRYYRLNPAWALAMPLAALFYLGATMHSAAKYWNGSGGDWKGRVQDVQDPHITETPLC